MRTIFSRLFALSASLIVLCLLIMGVVFRLMLGQSLEEEQRQRLHKNALLLADLASAYDATGELEHRWGDFHICLTTTAEAAGSDVMLCDTDGRVTVCSCQELDCFHLDMIMEQAIVDAIAADGEVFTQSSMGGLYETEQFVSGVRVISQEDGQTVGLLVITAPKERIENFSIEATTIFDYVSIFVLVIALIMCYILSRNQSRSIQQVTRAAARFGHGDLGARAAVGGKNTQEVDELAVSFNNMAETMAKSEQRRKEFVANVSHELKTPMTTIAGFMDGMLDGTIPAEQHRHYMQMVSDEIRRLSRLVRSMLEISRLQSQGIDETKKRRFDLCETIGQVLISFEQRINRKHIHVDVQMPDRSVWTKADPDSITQVVYNLTDNAIKFCDEGGMLRLLLSVDGGKARVDIQNSGEVIDPAELPLIFDRFHKADKSRSADPEGAGLGLYIVKTILNSHGEDISVTSERNLTTFTFTLPVVR